MDDNYDQSLERTKRFIMINFVQALLVLLRQRMARTTEPTKQKNWLSLLAKKARSKSFVETFTIHKSLPLCHIGTVLITSGPCSYLVGLIYAEFGFRLRGVGDSSAGS